MKPRVFSSTDGQVLFAANLDTIQDSIRDVAKCYGQWLGNSPEVWCEDCSTLVVGPHKGVVIAGIELEGHLTPTTVSLDGVLTATGWWYLYARNNGSDVVEYFLSEDSPEDDWIFKDGDPDSRYVCSVQCFNATLHSEKILAFRKTRNRVHYRWSGGTLTSTDFRALNGGTATSATDVDLTTWIPPRVRQTLLRATWQSTTTGTAYILKVSSKGAGIPSGGAYDAQINVYGILGNNGDERAADEYCECDINGKIQYRVNNAACSAFIYVRGYEET